MATSRDRVTPRATGGVASTIAERLAQELVIALVGPVGSGVSTAATYLREILGQQQGYVSRVHRATPWPPSRDSDMEVSVNARRHVVHRS